MNNKLAGVILIGFSLLSIVIAYGFDQLSESIKKGATFVHGGGSISSGPPTIPNISLTFIIIVVYDHICTQ